METVNFHCTSCRQLLKIAADKAGRKVKCVKCRAVLTVPAADPPTTTAHDRLANQPDPRAETETYVPDPNASEAEPDTHEEPRKSADKADERRPKRKKKKRSRPTVSDDPAWGRVRLGLLLLVIAVGVTAANLLVNLASSWAPPRYLLQMSFVMMKVGMGVTGVIVLLQVAGYSLCLGAPDQTARQLALVMVIATVVSGVAGLLLLWETMAFTPKLPDDYAHVDLQELQKTLAQTTASLKWMTLLTAPLQLLGYVPLLVVPLFLRRLAQDVGAGELDQSCNQLLKLNVALVILNIVTSLLSTFFLLSLLFIMPWIGGITALLHVVQAVWFVMIAIRVRQAIASRND